jgi:dephospho-CoA kinase
MLSFKQHLEEGVNDPAIFKAVFLAGGPGSGKSFIVGKTALQSLGFKLINSDVSFENALAKAGLKTTPEDIYSEKGQMLRIKAKALTAKQMKFAVDGRLGLVIDGTGKDYEKIKRQVIELKKIGYECAMIFVNTDLDTAIHRDSQRDRSLGAEEVTTMWKAVQNNMGKFQNMMGNHMYIVDNSEGSNYVGATNSVYKRIGAWSKQDPTMPQAKAWLAPKKKA